MTGPAVPTVAVGVVARDPDGRLLMIRRGHPPAEGTWSLPGGRVEPGETLAAAATREVAEETGLTVRVADAESDAPMRGIAGVVERISEGFHYVIIDLWAQVDPEVTPRPGDDAADAALVPVSELPTLPLAPGLAGFLAGIGVWPDPTVHQAG